MWKEDRLPWELEGGPEVGVEIPITGEPRREEAPGVPADPPPEQPPAPAEPEQRKVVVRDPELSGRANEVLTEEVREVVGTDRVTVPSDRLRPSRGERPQRQGLLAFVSGHRFMVARTFAAAIVVGGIISLVTGNWWFLPLAAGLHALGTMTIAAMAIRMTTISERPSPTTVAMLEEEGVRNPEEHFSNIVDEFTPTAQSGGTADVVLPGANERTAEAHAEPAKAAAEQSSAMTPTAGPSRPVGEGAPRVLAWSIVLGLAALSIVLPASAGGGWLWLMAAIIVPLAIVWVLLQLFMAWNLAPAAREKGRPLVIGVVCATALAVAGFCALVALFV